MARRSPEMLRRLLRQQPVADFEELRAALAGASPATVFRYLKEIPYRSSYSHNGRYYALHDPGRYDRWGLRSVGDIHFAIDGTLKATVVRLVRESEDGRTQRELQELLRVRVQLFALAAVRDGTIARERIDHVFVYLHIDPEVRGAQVERRRARIREAADVVEVGDEAVIRVLLVLIWHPGSAPVDVVRHLQGRSPPIGRDQVDAVFSRFGLGEKGGPRIY